MNSVGNILILLAVLVFAACMLCTLNPKWLKNSKTGAIPKRLHLLAAGTGIPLILFVAGGAMVDPVKPAAEVQAKDTAVAPSTDATPVVAPPAEAVKVAVAPVKNLGMTPDVFRKNFNSFMSQIDKSWNMAKPKIADGEVRNTFNAQIAPAAHLVGTVDKKSGEVHDLMVVIGAGKGSDNLLSMTALLSVAHASTQGASKEEISKAVTQLATQALQNTDNPKPEAATAVVGNREYTANASPLTGLMFAISAN